MLDVIDLNLEFHDHLVPETVVYHLTFIWRKGILSVSWGNPDPENP